MTKQPETTESLRQKLDLQLELNEVYTLTIRNLCDQLPAGAYKNARDLARKQLAGKVKEHVANNTEINDNLETLDG